MPTITSEPIRLGPITVTFLVEAEASGGSVTVSRWTSPPEEACRCRTATMRSRRPSTASRAR